MMQMMPLPTRDPVRIPNTRKRLIHAVGLGVWMSGVAWLVLHYFMMGEGDFGPAPHPLEPWSLRVHGFFAFASLWTLGLLWGQHVVGGWKTGRHRISGSLMLALLVWLVASGYLLYYLGSDETRSAVALIHWAVGLALPLPFIIHRFMRAVRTRN